MQDQVQFPISLTDKAARQILKVRDGDPQLGESYAVRISCKGGGCSGIMYNLDFDDEIDDEDLVNEMSVDSSQIRIVTDPHSASYLQGLTVDFVRDGLTEGFKFEGASRVKRTCGCGQSFSV